MRSVGTRTSLPCAPPPPHSCRSGGGGMGGTEEERNHSFAAVKENLCNTDRSPPSISEGDSNQGVSNSIRGRSNTHWFSISGSNGERRVSNSAFVNGRGAVSLDICGNNMETVNNDKNRCQYKDAGTSTSAGHKMDNCKNPPNILPLSGKLEQVQTNDGLVRPSAFKPVVPKSFHSMQNLVCPPGGGGGAYSSGGSGGSGPHSMPGPFRNTNSPGAQCGVGQSGLSDSGRNSLTSLPTYAGSSSGHGHPGVLSASTSHINQLGASVALDTPDKPGGNGGGYQNGMSTSDSSDSSFGKRSFSFQRPSHLGDPSALLHPPSPSSDDVIQDLEDRLWEREQEMLSMRRNLDQSEAAIVQVFEEKQRAWERQMDELRQNYASRLQQVTRHAQRSQNALQAQISCLSRDKRRLQEELAALLAQREELERRCLDYRKEQADMLPRLEETKWEVCQKAGEISLLKQQLRESQAEVTQRAGEMVALRGQLKELNAQLRQQEEAMLGLQASCSSKSSELGQCEGELRKTLTEVSLLRDKLGVFEVQVTSLKQALSEIGMGAGGGGVEARSGSSRGSRGASRSGGGLPSPCSPPGSSTFAYPALPPPATPAVDATLSLQSDEAKVQRREAHQRQEAHQYHKPHQWQEVHQSQEVSREEEEAGDLRRRLEHLQAELRLERQRRERQTLDFNQERHAWMDEKERVLKYQAQLQLSYVETLQKNQALELRVGQLGGEGTSTALTSTTITTTPPSPISSPGPNPHPAPATPLSTLSLSDSPPPMAEDGDDNAPLAPPWSTSTRLERIESTEI